MKTNLGRNGKGEGNVRLQAKFCNLIVPSQKETREQNDPEYLLLIQLWKTSLLFPIQFVNGASGFINQKSKCLKNEVL